MGGILSNSRAGLVGRGDPSRRRDEREEIRLKRWDEGLESEKRKQGDKKVDRILGKLIS